MSHPKNTTVPSKAQEAPLTAAMPFYRIVEGDQESTLLQVRAGKPATEAVDLASMLLGSTLEILTRLTESGMSTNEIFAIRFLVESSAALVDASAQSIEFGNRQGGAL